MECRFVMLRETRHVVGALNLEKLLIDYKNAGLETRTYNSYLKVMSSYYFNVGS